MKTLIERITLVILIATPIVWILWDLIAYMFGGNPATESANVDVGGYLYPSIPIFWGYLTSHFFAQKRLPSKDPMPNAKTWFQKPIAWIALGFPSVILIWDLLSYPSLFTRFVKLIPGPGHGALEMVSLGIVIGYFCFQMEDQVEI